MNKMLHKNHSHQHYPHTHHINNRHHHHQQLQQHNSLPGNYTQHLDSSLNSTLSSGSSLPYNSVMPSNDEIISCPLTANTSSGATSVFFKSVSKPVKLKFWGNIFKRRHQRKRNPNAKQSLDKTNSYLLSIGTPVAAR